MAGGISATGDMCAPNRPTHSCDSGLMYLVKIISVYLSMDYIVYCIWSMRKVNTP